MDILSGAIILGLVQAMKMGFKLASRWIPLVAIVTSLLLVWIMSYLNGTILTWEILQNALMIGLSACGLWEVGKTSVLGKR